MSQTFQSLPNRSAKASIQEFLFLCPLLKNHNADKHLKTVMQVLDAFLKSPTVPTELPILALSDVCYQRTNTYRQIHLLET